MNRRDFITLLGGAAAWPLAARAQQPSVPVIGLLHPTSADRSIQLLAAFRQGLGETGYVEGRNLTIEYRWADGHNDRLPELAADLARRRVAVIVALQGDSSARAAKAATATIPIVFMSASDAVRGGLVASLNRPGGNLTGVSQFGVELMPKRLDLLCQVLPNAAVIDMLVNPEGAITADATKAVDAASRLLGRRIRVHTATSEPEIDAVFAQLAQLHANALLIMGDSFFTSRAARIGALTVRYAIPAIYRSREFTTSSGLMTYDINRTDSYREAGVYVGRILRGEKPGDLPVVQPTKFELVINLTSAKALGLAIPPGVYAIADEVIE
jgi:putative ABC transport system substrate-binding protein